MISNSQKLFYLRHARQLLLAPRQVQFDIDGDCFTVRPRTLDGFIINEVYKHQDYRPTFQLDGAATIVDLGAQIGVFSVWAHKMFQPTQLICVEPDDQNRELLNKNLKQNDIKAIIDKRALARDDSGVLFRRDRFNSGGHKVVTDYGKPIASASLKQLLHQVGTVDYLKVDIEGSERFLLEGENLAVLNEKVSYLNMEVHKRLGVDLESAAKVLKHAGYTVKVHPQPGAMGKFVALLEALKQ